MGNKQSVAARLPQGSSFDVGEKYAKFLQDTENDDVTEHDPIFSDVIERDYDCRSKNIETQGYDISHCVGN